jgi:DNA-binding NtrC family response regulator
MRTGCRILLVGHSESSDRLAARLHADGYTVDTVDSCEDALNLARSGQYSIYFVESEVVESNDMDIIAAIRVMQPDASVIVISRGKGMSAEDFTFLARTALDNPPLAAGVMSLEAMEKQLIGATLTYTGGNIREAAHVLGIDRSTLYEKIRKYEIPRIKPKSAKPAPGHSTTSE